LRASLQPYAGGVTGGSTPQTKRGKVRQEVAFGDLSRKKKRTTNAAAK